MPKFEIESQIDLKATLSGLGVDAMSNQIRCDFSRMINKTNIMYIPHLMRYPR